MLFFLVLLPFFLGFPSYKTCSNKCASPVIYSLLLPILILRRAPLIVVLSEIINAYKAFGKVNKRNFAGNSYGVIIYIVSTL